MDEIIWFILGVAIICLALWLAGKITNVEIELKETLIIASAVSAIELIPVAGPILSIIALFLLLKHFTSVAIYPDLLLIFIVSKLFSWLMVLAISDIVIRLFT